MNNIIANIRTQLQKLKCRIANLSNRVTYIEDNCCNGGGGSGIQSIQDGNGTDINNTDPNNPIINILEVSDSQKGIVNNTPLQELGGVDKLINGVRIGRGSGNNEDNLIVGKDTLSTNTTGTYNTAFGGWVLTENTTGSFNSSFGSGALYSNTTGIYNNAFGTSTLQNNTTGSRNVGVGTSLFWNSTGQENTGVGSNAGYGATTGSQNTYIGNQAGYNNGIGSYNTAIGSRAMITSGTGIPASTLDMNRNVFIGVGLTLVDGVNDVLAIDNKGATNTFYSNALLYGNFADRFLRINGRFEIDPATMPTADIDFTKKLVYNPTDGKVTAVDDTSGGGIQSIVPGDNITVDNTDPQNPIISANTEINKSTEFITSGTDIKYPTIKAITDYFFYPSDEVEIVPIIIRDESLYLSNRGTILTPTTKNWRVTEEIFVNPGDKYIYYGNTDISGSSAICVYGYGVNPQVIINKQNGTTGIEFTIPTGVTSIILCSYLSTTINLMKIISEGGGEESGKIRNELLPSIYEGKLVTDKTWGCIGHSIWAQDGVLVGIQTLIQLKITFGNYRKYAYSGNSLGGLTSEDSSSILQTNKTNTWVSNDIFTYDSITNDFKRNIPIGTTSDFINNTGITTYYGALRVLHDKLKSLNPNYIMICGNALKRNNASYTSWSANTEGHTLEDYSVALEWVANRLSWKFINQFRDSLISDDNLSSYTSDGLHPNNAGYLRIYHLWYNEFIKILI